MTEAAHDDYQLPEGFEHCSKLDPVRDAPSALDRVKQVVRILHEPGGCPWDGEQTNTSLLKPLLEETYEYIDAVETNDRDNMREELGDMLLQSVFQAQVCAVDAQDPFNIDEVCNRLVNKLITRHPHVFQTDDAADDSVPAPESAQDTLKLWETMKQKEKHRKSVLEGISHAQGALPRATKIVSRVTNRSIVTSSKPHSIQTQNGRTNSMMSVILMPTKSSPSYARRNATAWTWNPTCVAVYAA